MITKSGIETKNFEYESAGLLSEDLYITYTADVPTQLFVLENENGMEACITNLGGRLVSLMVPDYNSDLTDVVLGFDNLQSYVAYEQRHHNVFGAIIGRYANRIANGKFSIGDKEYKLPQNNGKNCLHGGPYGWAYQTFTPISFDKDKSELVLQLISPDGDMGFPGEIKFTVTYSLHSDNSLHIKYNAKTNAPTVLNVTNHSYFNLSGNPANNVLYDRVFICSEKITPINEDTCPTGSISTIKKEGIFDFYNKGFLWPKLFRSGKPLGLDIEACDQQIILGNGYDHNFVLLKPEETTFFGPKPYDKKIPYCAKVYNAESKITMEIFTTEPGVQLYDSADLDGSLIGKGGIPLNKYSGLCLETQHFANSPNISHFPSTLLNPNQDFESRTVYKFS